MNKLNFFPILAILLMATLASCSDIEKVDPNVKGAPAMLEIQLKGTKQDIPMMKLKSKPGEAAPVKEDSIQNGIIMVFDGNALESKLDGRASFKNGVTKVKVRCREGKRYVYAVINTDTTRFKSVLKLQDLYNLTNKATVAEMNKDTQKGIYCPMSGSADVDASHATTEKPVSLTITMRYVCNKFEVDWDLSHINASMAGLAVDSVFLLNVKSQSDYFLSPTATTLTDNVSAFSEGLGNYSNFTTGQFYPTAPSVSAYDANFKIKDLVNDKGFGHNYFYGFENDGNATQLPTEVVIQAHKRSTTYFYPIVVNGPLSDGDGSSKVQRAMTYRVLADIRGAGNDNPFDPINAAAINITIIPAQWESTLDITEVFN